MQENNFSFKNIICNNFSFFFFFFENALKEKTFQKDFHHTIVATLHNLKQKFKYKPFYDKELNSFLNFLLKTCLFYKEVDVMSHIMH